MNHLQEQNDKPVKKLVQDVDTRWNSTYYMLERFAEQSDLVTTTLCLLRKNDMCISNEELELINKTVAVLEPFEELTKEMSSEKFTSISKIIPMARGIQEFLKTIVNKESQDMFPLGRQLQEQN